VLDITGFSSVIYILYEGGELRPALVTTGKFDLALSRSFRALGELNR
jgi:hypothetical protein